MLDLSLREARTVATTTLVLIGLYLILALEAEGRRRSGAVGLLVALLLGGYVGVLLMSLARGFFLLAPLSLAVVSPALGGAALAALGLAALDPAFVPFLAAGDARARADSS